MYASNSQMDWQLIEDESVDIPDWAKPVEGREPILGNDPAPRQQNLVEFVFGFAVLFGISLFLLWQWSQQRIAHLEGELADLRQELGEIQHLPIEVTPIAKGGREALSLKTRLFETKHLQFVTSAQTADLVEAVIESSNAKYEQLLQDFGLPFPPAEKLTIQVDRPIETAINSTNDLTTHAPRSINVPHPAFAAKRHGIAEVDALTNEINLRLSRRILAKALEGRTIKPQWQSMTRALRTHLSFVYGHNQSWRSDPTIYFLLQRHSAQKRLISVSQEIHADEFEWRDEPLQPSQRAQETANTLIEFILESYGYTHIPTLLDAFEEHESWETLSPAVFGVPADVLQEEWHTFLKGRYPRPEK